MYLEVQLDQKKDLHDRVFYSQPDQVSITRFQQILINVVTSYIGYFCTYCNCSFQYKSKFERHLASEKHKANLYMLEDTDIEFQESKRSKFDTIEDYVQDYLELDVVSDDIGSNVYEEDDEMNHCDNEERGDVHVSKMLALITIEFKFISIQMCNNDVFTDVEAITFCYDDVDEDGKWYVLVVSVSRNLGLGEFDNFSLMIICNFENVINEILIVLGPLGLLHLTNCCDDFSPFSSKAEAFVYILLNSP